jgi:hypothetical protein
MTEREDIFEKAIRDAVIRQHAGDIYTLRRDIAVLHIDPSMHTARDLRVPLSAEASVLFDRYRPQVMIRAEGWSDTEKGERLGVQKLFTYDGIDRKDVSSAVAYLTENLMRMIAEKLVRGVRNDGL